jgi:TolB-like protein
VAPPAASLPTRWKVFGGAVVGLLAATLWLRFAAPATPAEPARPPGADAVAVLPFLTPGPDTADAALGPGLARELVDALGHASGLRVADPVSVRAALERAPDTRALGRRLGVGAVLEGTLRVSGDRLRVSTRLVSVARGFDLWTESFDQPAGDLLAVRDSIARSVVATLRPQLQPLKFAATSDTAFRSYLRGREAMARGATRRAVLSFGEAVRLDSTYSPAWAGLAGAYTDELLADTLPPAGPAEAARAAANRALALQPGSAPALLARGIVRLVFDRAWAAAAADLRRADALEPGDPDPAHWRSHLFLAQGMIDSSLAASADAIARSPYDPSRRLHLAWHYAMARADTLAATTLDAVSLDSALLATDRHLPLLLEIAGDSASAFTDLNEALNLAPGRIEVRAELARLHALAERPDSARAMLAAMAPAEDSVWVSPYALALVHAALGARRAAFEAIGRALEERDPAVVALALDPRFAGLRRDRRFTGLVRRLAADYNPATSTPPSRSGP